MTDGLAKGTYIHEHNSPDDGKKHTQQGNQMTGLKIHEEGWIRFLIFIFYSRVVFMKIPTLKTQN